MSKANPRNALLELALLTIVKNHVGAEYAISRSKLLNDLRQMGYELDDRKMRKVIESLRTNTREGSLICGLASGRGYFYASTLEEFKTFERIEDSRGRSIVNRMRMQSRRAIPILSNQGDIS